MLQLLLEVVADRWLRWSWRASDLGGEGAQLVFELGNGVACGGREGLVVHRCSIEGMDGCFDDGESVAKRTDEVVCALRVREAEIMSVSTWALSCWRSSRAVVMAASRSAIRT